MATNRKFSDIYTTKADFTDDYSEIAMGGLEPAITTGTDAEMSEADALTLVWKLLIGKYRNSSIASNDESIFKYALFGTIFRYGPTWRKELAYQKKLRELTFSDLQEGSTMVSNHAVNPETVVNDGSIINGIAEQNTQKYKKSTAEAIGIADALLKRDVTGEFLARFAPLFKVFVAPDYPWWSSDSDL